MRNCNDIVLSAADNQTTNGDQIDSSQIINISFQPVLGDTQAAGTLKVQMSNDVYPDRYQPKDFTVVNWSDIPSATSTITAGVGVPIILTNVAYRWMRVVYTTSATGAQTIAPIADTGVIQHQTVTTVADVAGSLNSKYFLLSSVNLVSKAQKNFYMWFNINSAGVDPAIAGRTGIEIDGATGASANALATSMRTALNALTNDFVATGSNAAVIITDVAFGPVTAAVDGVAATGFTFGSATAGVASNLNNKYFLLQDEASAHLYYVWMNVDAIGTNPMIAGRTGVEIDFASGATAATIGGDLATAIAALNSTNSFTTSGTTTVIVTNKTAGPFVPMSDGAAATGFAFAITAGGSSTIVVQRNSSGV